MCKACKNDSAEEGRFSFYKDRRRSCREARRKDWTPVALKPRTVPSKMTHKQLIAELGRQARRIHDPREV